ncbi:MAG: sigma 54-interacting transcriptional regulator [Bacteroidota bacterium]
MNVERIKFLLIGAGIALVILLVTSLIPATVDSIDRTFLWTEYHLRGEQRVDSSVVILYFSSDDLAILGDLPLKRSYYALLVNALNDIGAKVIGFDIGFTEEDKEHAEYDRLFCSIVKKSGNVVVSGYFRSLLGERTSQTPRSSNNIGYPIQPPQTGFYGNQPEFPYNALLSSSAGFGHTNLDDNFKIPLLVNYGNQEVPSFFLEVLRVALDVPRSNILFKNNSLAISSPVKSIVIPTDNRTRININYAGKIGLFPVYPVIQFLKAYDTLKMGISPALQVENIKGKIVLVGIIAEGRSAFIPTPFQTQFPSIGIHAMAIHNAIEGSFLTIAPQGVEFSVALLIAILCTLFLSNLNQKQAASGFIGLIVISTAVLVILYIHLNIFVPPTRILITAVGVSLLLLIIRHQQVQNQLHTLSTERSSIIHHLQEKESILAALEKELNDAKELKNNEGRINLIEDVRKFKNQIEQLKLKAEQSQPAVMNGTSSAGVLKDFYGILYHSNGPMTPVIDFVKMIADNDAPVLILGESGTGKELVAKGIHQLGNRKQKPFIAVNCGALTETLLESELFGHEKGAFTGAVKEKPGRFELADGGTIFLDEIGETSEAFQVKLLRVIQEGVFERVGGIKPRQVNVRVITATNRDIKHEVQKKSFREDLYYRLNVFTVQLPPLRERIQDLPHLINAFIVAESPSLLISVGALELLQNYEWKGNIRELQSVIKRAVLLARAENRMIIHTKDLPEELHPKSTVAVKIEEKIMDSIRRKQFSRNAISETALELGGLNRGTVSEYFRGECFRIFVEQRFDVRATALAIAGTTESEIVEKVEKRFIEFLQNATENVNFSKPIEEIKSASKPKYKNLALRYHPMLDSIIEAYYNRKWSFDH